MARDDTAPLCPLTGAPMRRWLHVPRDWRRPAAPGGWQLWWSDAGDYGQIHPRPDAAEIAAFYRSEAYYTHDPDRRDPDPPPRRSRRPADRLRMALAHRLDRGVQPDAAFWAGAVPPGARAGLEIGCGNGDRMVALAPLIGRVAGLEPDPAACTAARAKGLTVHPGTAEDLPPAIAATRYDFILFTHVLEHCADPVRALGSAAALLSPNGVLVLARCAAAPELLYRDQPARLCRPGGPCGPGLPVLGLWAAVRRRLAGHPGRYRGGDGRAAGCGCRMPGPAAAAGLGPDGADGLCRACAEIRQRPPDLPAGVTAGRLIRPPRDGRARSRPIGA